MTDKSAREIILNSVGDTLDKLHVSAVIRCTDAILAALEAGGFAVVPKEPTPEMLTAMHDAWDYFDANSDVFRREYKAALAASNPKEEGK